MIFKIILIIFLIGLLVVGFFAAKFTSTLREGVKLFREQAKGSAQQRQHHRNTTQVMVDHRDADEINKEVFRKDEDEYVELEEEPVEMEKQNQAEATISLPHPVLANGRSVSVKE